MHAHLIVGKHSSSLEHDVKRLTDKYQQIFEFPLTKIQESRELADFLKLAQSTKTAVVIKNIDEATTETLNSFLKHLEEPQENIEFILTARSEHKVLPTIVSRCRVIRVAASRNEQTNETDQLVDEFINGPTSERLTISTGIKKREEAILFLKNLLEEFRQDEKAKNVNLHDWAYFMKFAEETLSAINANGNVTLQLTNFIVKLDGLEARNRV